ncbi:MAG TPA: hypothetical protein VMU94_18725 [Streptosporangiaceae bacterium]|nr:hypothetical protein [Streptosporangiaceae bacterium]
MNDWALRPITGVEQLPDGPRQVVLECPPGMASKFALFGATSRVGVSLVTVDDR